jgi:hypothetical protein
MSPKMPGPKAFGSSVRNAVFPSRFRALSNITKYNSKTNPGVWLEDYRVASHAGGADDDLFIIQYLPIYLEDSTKVWLGHQERNSIDSWEDLRRIFIGTFQGTYVRPGNS